MTVLLLKPEAFAHEALEAGFVEQVVGEFFVGEHGEGGAFGAGSEFGGFFDGKAGVLADDGGDHAHHHLQATDQTGFVVCCGIGSDIERIVFVIGRLPRIHATPFLAALSAMIWMLRPRSTLLLYLLTVSCAFRKEK